MVRYKVEEVFEVKGYKCVVIGGMLGFRCGYLELPADSKLYGKHYDKVNEFISVHGGWTYSDYTYEVNYPIESSAGAYWIGFDCGHIGDAKDFELIKSLGDERYIQFFEEVEGITPSHGTIKTVNYVKEQLINAVEQIIKFDNIEDDCLWVKER